MLLDPVWPWLHNFLLAQWCPFPSCRYKKDSCYTLTTWSRGAQMIIHRQLPGCCSALGSAYSPKLLSASGNPGRKKWKEQAGNAVRTGTLGALLRLSRWPFGPSLGLVNCCAQKNQTQFSGMCFRLSCLPQGPQP